MRLIPGRTKVKVELFKGVSLTDILIGLVAALLAVFLITSNIPGKYYIVLVVVLITACLLVRMDKEPNYIYIMNIIRHFGIGRNYLRGKSDAVLENREDTPEEPAAETAEERKARIKAEKREYKEDDRRLRSSSVSKEEKDAIWLKRANQSAERKKRKKAESKAKADDVSAVVPFTGIRDGFIEYNGEYYGAVIEVPPVEFRFFSPARRINAIEHSLGRLLRSVAPDFGVNIVKIERPMIYDGFIGSERKKADDLKHGFEAGEYSEDELKARLGTLYERIDDLNTICYKQKVIEPFYYIVLFDSDRTQLSNSVSSALDSLRNGEMNPRRLNDKELAVFLKYTYEIDFDERSVDLVKAEDLAEWAKPSSVYITPRTVELNGIITHNLRIVNYPSTVDDGWLASVMSMSATKVVVKCRPMNRDKAIRNIDFSLQELRGQYAATGIDSRKMELEGHIDTLSSLLSTLQGDNESLLETNIYITGYDITASRGADSKNEKLNDSVLVGYNAMKRSIRRAYSENNLRLNGMDFNQLRAFIGSQVSAYDPMSKDGRGIPSNTVAASFPWVFAHVNDENGVKLGSSDGCPVFVDFFRRDSERVNSNMVIVGKSGSGKSYATKTILANLAADDAKVFILDPENEYSELAENLHGKCINVGNAKYGRLNPFNIITALDDEDEEGNSSTNSYSTHLQFLEEFFKQILPDCEKDALEYLNSIVDRMYMNFGIGAETPLSSLTPEDYPTFDNLYDLILKEFQSSNNDYIRGLLRVLMNYISKFAAGGRNASIWNGPSSITTDENFTVFNFQSLLANRNGSIANAQMLLVLKYIDNEIIKNREYNKKYNCKRKVVVVIDEAHVFIDTKYPVALDFMFQLAKRIRKYNGMQIVITQNIKDFVGSEEIARKSTAIINACQYSFIFSLAPNDMDDLCRLYEKAGGINEQEQEQIVSAPRGQAFAIMSAQSRSTFRIDALPDMIRLFKDKGHVSPYFTGSSNLLAWDDYIRESRKKRFETLADQIIGTGDNEEQNGSVHKSGIDFSVITEEEYSQYELSHASRSEVPVNAAAAPVQAEEPAAPAVPDKAAEMPAEPAAPAEPAISKDEIHRLIREEYRGLADEIYRTVKLEIENDILKSAIAEKAAAAEAAQSAAEQAMTADIEDVQTEAPAEEAPAAAADEEPEEPAFDIMKLLLASPEMNSDKVSPIEMMSEFGEEILTITLDELIVYNLKH